VSTDNTTHTYVSIAAHKDWQTWFGVLSMLALLLQDREFVTLVPAQYHLLLAKVIVAINLILRFTVTTRPVAMTDGVSRTVQGIEPKVKP
jgi:hypothetical protein